MTVNGFQKHKMITHSKASANLSLSTPRSKEGDKGFTSRTHTFTDHVTSISNISITGKRELQISLKFKYHVLILGFVTPILKSLVVLETRLALIGAIY